MFKVNLDKVVYKIGERALLSLSFKNTSSEAAKKDVYLELRLNGELKMAFLAREGISLGPGEEYRETIEVPLPREEGLGELNVYLVENGEVVRKNVELGIVDPSKRKPLMVAFVWHHHQAPNFYPDGTFHSLWAFTHVYDDEFPPFEGGAYYIHVKNHEKHTKIKDCDHVSPSLLLQWKAVIERGAKTVHGRIEPDDPKIERVRYVLEKFREMSAEGKVEILGDLFAHTVQGLVIDLFSKRGMKKLALEILDWELRYGKRITREVLDCEPIGAWTPEMYWSPELAELYSRNGYKYTVLCDQHFRASSGEKGSIYEPYRVEYNGNSIVIFFRDRELSDWISFRNNFTDEEHAEREARGFTLTLLEKYFKHPGGICVIALDGENWMIGSMTREYVPLFFDLLWRYIEESEKVFKTVTLSEYLKNRDGNSFKTLKYIPKGSWAGLSNAQWVGGVKDDLWNFVLEKARWVAALSNALPHQLKKKMLLDEKSPLFRAYRALSIAIDSDYFWFGDRELEQKVIKAWAEEAERISREVLEKIKIQSIHISSHKISVLVKNNYQYPLNLWLKLEDITREEEIKILVEGGSTREIALDVDENIRCIALTVPPIVLKKIALSSGIFL